jgi:hypothetical protein
LDTRILRVAGKPRLVAREIYNVEPIEAQPAPPRIKTAFYAPPIPYRFAWYDDLGEDGSPIGTGETEAAAVADLLSLTEA